MTNIINEKDKELLTKELCTRLPYGIIVNSVKGDGHLCSISKSPFGTKYGINIKATTREYFNEEYNLRPYLRPMSSMTIDELNDCVTNDGLRDILCPNYEGSKEECEQQRLEHSIKVFKTDAYRVDWLNAHHFDYNGLIEIGLALEAPHGMYN